MPLVRFPTPAGLVYTIDLTKIADRENPRTVEAPLARDYQEDVVIDWGDGSSSIISAASETAWPSHEYAAAGIYTVTVRSATGHLPYSRLTSSYNAAEKDNPTYNFSWAIVSLDHFAGWLGGQGNDATGGKAAFIPNLTYIDPRYIQQPNMTSLNGQMRESANIEQDVRGFCFDFVSLATNAGNTFRECARLYNEIPSKLFDQNKAITSLTSAFYGCSRLTGAPYVFWKADGTLDNTKFPSLTSGSAAYSGCSAAIRAQVPTDYGGTMTVS